MAITSGARRLLVLSALLVMALTSGCSGATSGPAGNQSGMAEAQLGDAMGALYLNPPSQGLTDGDGGSLLLVRPDGTYRELPTRGMDNGRLRWADDGLHFFDSDDYYVLASALSAEAVASPGLQKALFVGPDGRSTGVFNDGFTESGGYRTVVVTAGSDALASFDMPAFLTTTSICDNRVFGVGLVVGTDLEAYPGSVVNGMDPQMLFEITDAATGARGAIGMRTGVQTLDGDRSAPCRGGVIYSIAALEHTFDDPSTGIGETVFEPILLTWDTRSGEFAEIPLVDESGGAMTTDPDTIMAAWGGASSLDSKGESIRWWAGDGVVRSTVLSTGVTSELWRTTTVVSGENQPVAKISCNELHVIDLPSDPAFGEVIISRYSMADGILIEAVAVPGLVSRIGARLSLTDFELVPRCDSGR